jgi:cold shock CspA family protein
MSFTRRNALLSLPAAPAALAAMLVSGKTSNAAVPATPAPAAPPIPTVYVAGRIKWWNRIRGFGFVVVPGEDRDIFFEASKLDLNGVTRPSGHHVWVRYHDGVKGLMAEHVRVMGNPAAVA